MVMKELKTHPHPPPPSEGAVPNQLNPIPIATNDIIATAMIMRMSVNFL